MQLRLYFDLLKSNNDTIVERSRSRIMVAVAVGRPNFHSALQKGFKRGRMNETYKTMIVAIRMRFKSVKSKQLFRL